MFAIGDFCPCFQTNLTRTHSQSGTKLLEKKYKTCLSYLNFGKEQRKTVSHTPLPHAMLLMVERISPVLFNIEWGVGGWNFTRKTYSFLKMSFFSRLLSPIEGYTIFMHLMQYLLIYRVYIHIKLFSTFIYLSTFSNGFESSAYFNRSISVT